MIPSIPSRWDGESPTKEGYYLREVGTNPVYLVDSTFASTISQPSTAYIGRNVVTAPTVKTDDDNGQAILREIELTGRVRTSPLILRRSTADDNLNNSLELCHHQAPISAPPIRRAL